MYEFANYPLRIIIGGNSDYALWKTVNADPSTCPDIMTDIRELKGLEPGSATVVYMSHVLEHVSLRDLRVTLKKIYTIMCAHSTLFVSVPDLENLSSQLRSNYLNIDQKIHVLRMIYGGQTSEYDYHYFGYTEEILAAMLSMTGFHGIRRVKAFNLHRDTSSLVSFDGSLVSLNMVCHKCTE